MYIRLNELPESIEKVSPEGWRMLFDLIPEIQKTEKYMVGAEASCPIPTIMVVSS